MEQRYGTDPSNRYGTEVWNGGMERVWSRTLFRTLYFDLQPYIFLEYLHRYQSPVESFLAPSSNLPPILRVRTADRTRDLSGRKFHE